MRLFFKMLPADYIKNSISSAWRDFENLMSQVLKSESKLLKYINTYLLNSRGKKIRPLLAILTAKACSGFINEKALACAAVSELIHTATLLHDDVIDDSVYRRGELTVNKLYSGGTSLLVGDYWLTRSIRLLLEYDCPAVVLSAYAEALENLSEGEIMQMECADSLTTGLDDYLKIIRYKTASLFIASVKSPAIVSGASLEVIEKLSDFAEYLGICFQIRDDILDYHPSSETGKDSDSDIAERKVTLPLLCAFKNCSEKESYIRKLMSRIDMSAEKSMSNGNIIDEVKKFVIDERGVESAIKILKEYISKAVEYLSVLQDSPYRESLISITKDLGEGL